MKKKVIKVTATDQTVEKLYKFVKFMNENSSIRAYPSVDNEAVFFPVDKYDLKWLKSTLLEKGYALRIEDAL
jgi:hypothetical protein B2_07867